VKHSGASMRQLQFWDERGALVPMRVAIPGRGRPDQRRYTLEQLRHATLMVQAGFHIPLKFWKTEDGQKILNHRGTVEYMDGPVLVGKRRLLVPLFRNTGKKYARAKGK